MAEDLEEGDVVQLKSGGPRMTVTEVQENGQVCCAWFEDDETRSRYFPPKALKEVEDGPTIA